MVAQLLTVLRSNRTITTPGILAKSLVYGANFIGISYFLKNSLYLARYKNCVQRHGYYGPEEPADELVGFVNEIISKDLKDLVSENTPVGVYLTPGLETAHLGTVGTTAGGWVGVPIFYEFKNEQDAMDNVLMKDVGNEDGSLLKQVSTKCFILSDNAKKYGVAREILLINSLQMYFNALLPFAVSISVVSLYFYFLKTNDILKKPLYTRVLVYTVVILAAINLWRFFYRHLLHYYESEVEAQIVELGKDYIEGGIEYCTKELERNSISVEIKNVKVQMFKAVEDFFSKLLPRGIPVEVRLAYLSTHLKNLDNTDSDT